MTVRNHRFARRPLALALATAMLLPTGVVLAQTTTTQSQDEETPQTTTTGAAKTLDGLDRKLDGFGIVLPEDLGRIIGRAEEIMELGVAIMLMQALVFFLRDRSLSGAQMAPAGRPAATGSSAGYR